MASLKIRHQWGLIFLGAFLATGCIVSTHMAMKTLRDIKIDERMVSVKGYAEKPVVSDRASWQLTYGVREDSFQDAQKKIKESARIVRNFLIAKGVSQNAIKERPSRQAIIYKKIPSSQGSVSSNEIEFYEIDHSLEIDMDDVELARKVTASITDLASEGIRIRSNDVRYFYSKLDDLKMDLLKMATANALVRAKIFAQSTGARVGGLKEAKQGVFQVTPEFSTNVSDYGILDSSSINKMGKLTVSLAFNVES